MAKSENMFPDSDDPDASVKEVRSWLQSKGIRDFEPVSLFCDQLKKVWITTPSIMREHLSM